MKKKLIILCLFLFGIFACKKQVENGRPEFIGYWSGGSNNEYGYVYIHIKENSKAYFHVTDPENDDDYLYKGNARADNGELTIGGSKHFTIVEYPHPIDTNAERKAIYNFVDNSTRLANWKMVLNGPESSNQNVGKRTYYKADY